VCIILTKTIFVLNNKLSFIFWNDKVTIRIHENFYFEVKRIKIIINFLLNQLV